MNSLQLLFILALVFQASLALSTKRNRLLAKQTLKSCATYTISNVNWPNVYIRMEQSQTSNGVNIVDLHQTSSPDSQDQWKVYNYTASNKFGYYLCLQNAAQKYYMSINPSGCGSSQTDSGCGTVGISTNCYGNEQFVYQPVNNGHGALIAVNNPSLLLRTDGNHIVIYQVKQPDANTYWAGATAIQQQGGGVFNAQYYSDYKTASSWESYDFHLVQNSC